MHIISIPEIYIWVLNLGKYINVLYIILFIYIFSYLKYLVLHNIICIINYLPICIHQYHLYINYFYF